MHTYHVGESEILVHNDCSDAAWDIAMHSFDKHGANLGLGSVDDMAAQIDNLMGASAGTLRDDGSLFWVDYANSALLFRGPNAGVPGTYFRPDNFITEIADAFARSVAQ